MYTKKLYAVREPNHMEENKEFIPPHLLLFCASIHRSVHRTAGSNGSKVRSAIGASGGFSSLWLESLVLGGREEGRTSAHRI